jgi:hypothetical protein
VKHIRSSFAALAAILDDMGAAAFGADCISVQEQLANGQCIHSSTGVFAAVTAAILDNGFVATGAFLPTAMIPTTFRDSW